MFAGIRMRDGEVCKYFYFIFFLSFFFFYNIIVFPEIIWLSRRDCLLSRVHLGVWWDPCCLFMFVYCPILCLYVPSSVLWCPLRFTHSNDVWFVFTSTWLQDGSCLIYVICVCSSVVVSNTYCVVFFVLFIFVLCTLCCQFHFIVTSVLSNVYWTQIDKSRTWLVE